MLVAFSKKGQRNVTALRVRQFIFIMLYQFSYHSSWKFKVAKDLGGEFGQEVLDLFNEFEAHETPTAKFLGDLDKLEMLIQAEEYEDSQGAKKQFSTFFYSFLIFSFIFYYHFFVELSSNVISWKFMYFEFVSNFFQMCLTNVIFCGIKKWKGVHLPSFWKTTEGFFKTPLCQEMDKQIRERHHKRWEGKEDGEQKSWLASIWPINYFD